MIPSPSYEQTASISSNKHSSSNDNKNYGSEKNSLTTGQQGDTMQVEVDAAATFLTDYIIKAAKFSIQSAENFRRALTTLLKDHYEGHWYPLEPLKGSGYRCLRVNGVMNPLLKKAAVTSGLQLKKFRQAFPVELTVWVDPGDVSVRFGEDGSIGVYYAKCGGNGMQHDNQQMEDLKKLAAAAPRRASPNFSASTTETIPQPMMRRSPHQQILSSSPPNAWSSYVFSPYDGKSIKIGHNTHNNIQNMVSQRKFSPFLSSSATTNGRRTPPTGPSSYAHHQQQQQQHSSYFAQQQQAAYDFEMRRSPPASNFNVQQQQQPDLSEYQFYNNTHIGSTYMNHHQAAPFGGARPFMRQQPVGAN